jgi:hypothetical protein
VPNWASGITLGARKKRQTPCSSQETQWLEGAGGLLLVAAAQETGLLPALETALASCTPQDDSRLAHLSPIARRRLVLTLLFLNAVGLRRTWDLRGYTGDALALLTSRKRAYGYCYTERFLSQVAQATGAESFTDAPAAWTAVLWHPSTSGDLTSLPLLRGWSSQTRLHGAAYSWWLSGAPECGSGMSSTREARMTKAGIRGFLPPTVGISI